MAARGFQAIGEWKERSDEQRAQFGGPYTPFFVLRDGEMVEELWFNGADDEPLIIDCHTVQVSQNGGVRWMTILCRAEEGDCLLCEMRQQGDLRVSKKQNKAIFSVADPRWVHVVPDPGRDNRTKMVPCELDDEGKGKCPLCRRKVERTRAGQRRWEMSMTWGQALGVINTGLARRCTCGGRIKKGVCSKCNNPTPLNIFSVPFTTSRSGSGTSTSYQFQAGGYEEMPEWVAKLEPPEMEALYRVPSRARQGELIGVADGGTKREDGERRGRKSGTYSASSSIVDDDDLPF